MIRFAAVLMLAAMFAAPASAAVKFRHIVIVIQENRTPDNIFGSNPTFEPGVDIAASGTSSQGQTIPFSAVPLDGCYDINHEHLAFVHMYTAGPDKEKIEPLPKGCVPPPNPQFAYADNSAGMVQPYFDIAKAYGFANRMFQTNQGPSFPAHQFLFGGTSSPSTNSKLFAAENMMRRHEGVGCTAPPDQRVRVIDRTGNEDRYPPVYPCFERPTLSDMLDSARLGWRYYASKADGVWVAPNAISHICGALDTAHGRQCAGSDWVAHVVADNSARVLHDIAACDLQAVSWVVPSGENSDHAGRNSGTGPQWVASIVNAVGAKACPGGERYWQDTAILVTWDDWGGWSDHVPPLQITRSDYWGAGYTYGFRVPLLVVSAYTPAAFVDNESHDFGSVLYFVEQNFGLGFIGPGGSPYSSFADYHARFRGDMTEFFPLARPKRFVPIAAHRGADFFLHQPPSTIAPDDD